MAKRTEAYVDTSAFISFLDRSDSHHSLFARLFAAPPRLVTTPLVVAEGHAWFLKRFDSRKALQFLNFFEDLDLISTDVVGPKEIRAAAQFVRRFVDQPLTLTDALGLHVMKRRQIGVCWSTDHHLGLTGVPLVIHEV